MVQRRFVVHMLLSTFYVPYVPILNSEYDSSQTIEISSITLGTTYILFLPKLQDFKEDSLVL